MRPSAVAGAFYPADADELRAVLAQCFTAAVAPPSDPTVPKALVVPHAGLPYSGPVAASAYLRIRPGRSTIRQVVLLGPSHRVPFRGLASSGADTWATPLGLVPLDTEASRELGDFPWVSVADATHAPEHSLEVQLPFLQTVLEDFELLPLLTGHATTDEVASVLDVLWSGPETVIVVSTDLSHYHDYAAAVNLDCRTAAAITALRTDDIDDADACGAHSLRGLLQAGRSRNLEVEQLDLRNSGDTAGDRHRVVGYGAFALA
ncbi:MAG: AmmeMemoRadiSam system protein B [Acidimicrobiia bacterium]|nr:AmmeMemoRadiSam system protein B [Acidimicrobiia bacterium]